MAVVTKCRSTDAKYQWSDVNRLDDALKLLDRAGFSSGDPAYDALYKQRGSILAQIGVKQPRPRAWVADWATWSPVMSRIGYDPETGFFIAVKEGPNAPPTYKAISDEAAIKVLKNEVTPELIEDLLRPDEYLGEG